MKIKKSSVFLIPCIIFFFSFSYIFLSYYTEYDQLAYHKLYNFLSKQNFKDLLNLSLDDVKIYLNTSEPLSIFILWVGSYFGLEKNFYISILNTLFAIFLYLFLKKNKAPWFIYFFVISNFYFLVLLTAAERLKIAYIFLLCAILIKNNFIKNLIFIILPMAHLQLLVVVIGMMIYKLIYSIKLRYVKLIDFTYSLFIFIFLIWVINKVFFPSLTKFLDYKNYGETGGIFDSFFQKSIFLEIFFLYLIKSKFKFLTLSLPAFILSLIIGDWRLNIVIFTLGFYFILIEKKSGNLLFIILMTYFSLKSVTFLYNVFKYGHGFA
jgi:hypothetical protein